MKRLAYVLAAVLLLAIPSGASAQGLRQGDNDTRAVDKYTATYEIHQDGSIEVTIDLLFNFNAEPGHGIFVSYPTRVGYDDTSDRVYPISDVRASSPTGAPSTVKLEESDDWLTIRVGDETIGDVSGVQEYVVTYTLRGALDATVASDLEASIAPANDEPLFDEFHWNVIGDGWETPLNDITIVVKGDVGAIGMRCYVGEYGSTDGCTTAGEADGVATFTQDHLDRREGMTVAVAFPPASFDTTPILESALDPSAPTIAAPTTAAPTTAAPTNSSSASSGGSSGISIPESAVPFLAAGAGVLGIAIVGILLLVRGRKREATTGLYPGLAPGFSPDDEDLRGPGDGLL